MRVLVTGSSGHLGEALVRVLGAESLEVVGLDILPSPHTNVVGSVEDRGVVRRAMAGVEVVLHTATLHKPQVGTHTPRQFVDTNVVGTLNLLESAVEAGVRAFVLTSTTSVYGRALVPPAGAPAIWIDESTTPLPRNIYGVTKKAAEDLVELFHVQRGLPALVLRTSRFFPEPDDNPATRDAFSDANVKVNELLYRRVDLHDAASAHVAALRRCGSIAFERFVISATTPFERRDLAELAVDAPAVVRRLYPDYEDLYRALGWRPFERIERIYVNARARRLLEWVPRYDFGVALQRLRAGESLGVP
jgi:UDP-glucose 4-epimerase